MKNTTSIAQVKTLGIIWLSHFLIDFLIGIWPSYKTLAHIELSIAGLIVGVSGFIGDGSQIFFGFLSDRGLRKKFILLGITLAASASLLAYTNNCLLLFMLMMLTYLGSGAFHPAAVATVSDLIPSRKGMLVTIFASGGSAGLAFSQLLYSRLFHAASGHTLFLIIPVIVCFLFVFMKTFSQPTQIGGKKFVELIRPLSAYRKPLTLLYMSQVCQQAVMLGFLFFLPDLLRMRGNSHWICFGGGHCVFVLAAALMLVPVGYLSDKLGQKKLILCALILSFVLFYGFLFFPPLTSSGILLYLFAFGACMGVVNPLGVALGNKIAPNQSGIVSALMMGCVWCVAHCFGPASGGLLTCCFDSHPIIKSLSVLGGLFVVSIALAYLLPALPDTVQKAVPDSPVKQIA